ncbi:hypothetical protein, partial [Paenibacillus sp. 598K]|uniref:hypothetical protein n=1 Tax=Paenibacillus sp. 598K TaxID=1117987 RepID=UPI0016265E34
YIVIKIRQLAAAHPGGQCADEPSGVTNPAGKDRFGQQQHGFLCQIERLSNDRLRRQRLRDQLQRTWRHPHPRGSAVATLKSVEFKSYSIINRLASNEGVFGAGRFLFLDNDQINCFGKSVLKKQIK